MIYLSGKQYVGSTTERLPTISRERGGLHATVIFMTTFLGEGHNGLINDFEIIFIDKTDPPDCPRREEFWRLKTLAPNGLNVKECF